MAKRGLPETLRMRHDEHYVEALSTTTIDPVGRMVPIDLIDPNPGQPRQVMGDLSELMASVAEKGIIEPLVVRPKNGRYQIIAGERRYHAAVQVGLREVPVVVREADDMEVMEIARRGRDTLRFGPMKPVGLIDPRNGKRPYAVVQLRQENLRADSYNLVGFQNHLKFGDQARVMRMIPGLENAKFLRFGQIHRNTYINAPTLLNETLQMKQHPNVLFAGQISGVEGYVESIATGLLSGIYAAKLAHGETPTAIPRATAHGSLVNYICHAELKSFQPANITFDLLEQLDEATKKKVRDKKVRHQMVCERALAAFDQWMATERVPG